MQQQNAKETLKSSLLSTLKIVLVEWFLTSTAHALPNIFRTSSIALKVIWIACLLASGSYCIVSVSKSLQDFLAYPVFISTKITHEIPIQFPAVTLCNLKTINKTSSKEYFNNTRFSRFTAPNVSVYPFRNIISLQYRARTMISNDVNLTETKKRSLGYEMKDMLVSCTFNYEICTPNDFVYSFNPLYGNCYTFNKGVDQNGSKVPIRTTSSAGQMYGFTFELFLGEPEIETLLDFRDGLLISVHNQSMEPFIDGQSILVSANADTDIIVSKRFINKLPSPYSSCLKDTSFSSEFSSYPFDYIVRTAGLMYTQNHCFLLCVQKKITDACGCISTYAPSFNFSKRYCETAVETICLQTFTITTSSPTNKDCIEACPFECDSVEYETLSHKSFYPTKYYKKILSYYPLINNSGIKFDDIGEAIAKVNVYYKNLLYELTEENAQMTTEAFFSNVGGTLGLYLGISLLSIVEIVELAFNVAIAILSNKKKVTTVENALANVTK